MQKAKSLQYIALLPLLISFFYAPNVHAHPHSWIDLQTTIEGDETHITGFNMSWTFDAMTSLYMLEGQVISEQNREEILTSITDSLMDNLVLEHYFTYFYDGETPIPYLDSREATLKQHKNQLQLDFHIPLAEPKLITEAPLKLQVYESSYYVDMSWEDKGNIQLSSELAQRCSIQLIKPDPTAQQFSYAMSLPQDAAKDNTLGSIFTQTTILQCVASDKH